MKELLSGLFSDYGYSKVAQDLELYFPDEDGKQIYWLLIEASPAEVMEKQGDLFEQCNKLGHHAAVNKNTNLVCLWCVPDINSSVISEVHAAEEDLFFFKKHILYYTEPEFESLKKRIGSEKLSYVLSSLINDPETFSQYKELMGLGSWYELIYRIVIKLGFVDIGDGDPVDIDGLYSSHVRKIGSTKQPELLSYIESYVLGVDITDDPVKTLTDLVNAISEAGHEVNYK